MGINKNITKFNYTPGVSTSRIKFIVIHYCGSIADAPAQAAFFANAKREASAHYFVGHKGDIWQSVEDHNIAWHCGSKKYLHPTCRNNNSIGVEMCCKTSGSTAKADEHWYFEDATVKATIELTKELMKKYNVPASNVLRHYDVTGKCCPAPYVFNNGRHTWDEFKKAIGDANMVHEVSKVSPEKEAADNSKVIWQFLKEKELTEYAIAGIMGNLYAESGLRPDNLQNGFEKKLKMNDAQYTIAVDNGTYSEESFIKDKAGYGLAQWTFWTRKKGLYEFIKKLGKSIGDLKAQLEYFWSEISVNKPLMDKLYKARTVKEASDAVLHMYERPADQSLAVEKKRADFGMGFYDTYAGSIILDEKKVEVTEVKETVKAEEKKVNEFKVKVETDLLNIRKGPGKEFDKMGYTGKGVFTIVDTKENWGKLKSGNGWICLDYAERV